jgi:hypothetical protein
VYDRERDSKECCGTEGIASGRRDGGIRPTADLGAGKGGSRPFDVDGVGGTGSERVCMLEVGDAVTRRGGTEIGFMTGGRGSCGEIDEELGRGGTGGSSSCETRPCVM